MSSRDLPVPCLYQISPSPVKDLKASFEKAAGPEMKSSTNTSPDEMLMVKYGKSFEKAVDWTAEAVKKICALIPSGPGP